MADSVTLSFGGNTYTVRCTGVTVGWQNNNNSEANGNGTGATRVQTVSFNNPLYTIQGVYLTDETSTLTYEALQGMAKNKYDGTNPVTLTMTYGSNVLIDSLGSSTGISCVVKTFNFPIAVDNYDINGTRKPLMVGTITLEETA